MYCAYFLNAEDTESGSKVGYLVEFGETQTIFNAPQHEITRDYVTGRFG